MGARTLCSASPICSILLTQMLCCCTGIAQPAPNSPCLPKGGCAEAHHSSRQNWGVDAPCARSAFPAAPLSSYSREHLLWDTKFHCSYTPGRVWRHIAALYSTGFCRSSGGTPRPECCRGQGEPRCRARPRRGGRTAAAGGERLGRALPINTAAARPPPLRSHGDGVLATAAAPAARPASGPRRSPYRTDGQADRVGQALGASAERRGRSAARSGTSGARRRGAQPPPAAVVSAAPPGPSPLGVAARPRTTRNPTAGPAAPSGRRPAPSAQPRADRGGAGRSRPPPLLRPARPGRSSALRGRPQRSRPPPPLHPLLLWVQTGLGASPGAHPLGCVSRVPGAEVPSRAAPALRLPTGGTGKIALSRVDVTSAFGIAGNLIRKYPIHVLRFKWPVWSRRQLRLQWQPCTWSLYFSRYLSWSQFSTI